MKKRPDVLEWLLKAEQDYQTAETMFCKRKMPVPDIVGFHAQQCIGLRKGKHRDISRIFIK